MHKWPDSLAVLALLVLFSSTYKVAGFCDNLGNVILFSNSNTVLLYPYY